MVALTEKRIQDLAHLRKQLADAVSDFEWAYRGRYYGNADAPLLNVSSRRARRHAQELLDLIPIILKEADQEEEHG